jgi:hypothetical protein
VSDVSHQAAIPTRINTLRTSFVSHVLVVLEYAIVVGDAVLILLHLVRSVRDSFKRIIRSKFSRNVRVVWGVVKGSAILFLARYFESLERVDDR